NVRYPRELRDDLDALGRVLVMTPSGAQIPLSQVATIRMVNGPSMIRNENGLLAGYVYVDMVGRDVGGYVDEAKEAVARGLTVKPGYSLEWSGQYENMLRVRERLKPVVPITVFVIFFLLYMKPMPVAAASMGLMPIMWSTGTGADVMKRVAAPMVGGLVTSFLMELLVYPAIYLLWKRQTPP